MWHVSVAAMSVLLPEDYLRKLALVELEGVGDASRGQWEEYTGNAFHLRRRLSDDEQKSVGDAIDIRDTPEHEKRWLKVRPYLPSGYKDYKK